MDDMISLGSWIRPLPQGLFVEAGNFWIDPAVPVDRALITHGHADHARSGHQSVLATAETLAIMEVRYGAVQGAQVAAYGETLRINEVEISFIPAGHVLGSAQIVLH